MTPEEFVDAIRIVVVDGAAGGLLTQLRHPSGREPWPNLVELSDWFTSLDERAQKMVERVAHASAFSAAFDFCAVLDGVAAIDRDNGSLRLVYVSQDGTESILNDPEACELHAELRGDGPPPF